MRSVVAALMAASAASLSLAAYAGEPSVSVGPPITVTATRIDDALPVIGARIVTPQDIERSRAVNLSGLLRSLPEVRSRELQGSPNALIDMRGFGSSFGDQNTLVLVDGMRAREFEQLSVNWSAIALDSIERIEILPASGAVLHGSGAPGGIINIITKPPPSGSTVGLGASAASYDTSELRALGSIAAEKVALRVHGSRHDTDNYRDNNDVRIDNAHADLRWSGSANSLALKAGADEQRNGLPGVISESQIAANRRQALTPFDFATQRGDYVHLTARTQMTSGDAALNVGYRNRDTASSFLVGTPFRNNVDTTVTVWTLAPRLRIGQQFGVADNDLILGGDLEDWRFNGTSGPSIVGRPLSTQRSEALYAQDTITLSAHTTVSVGARRQWARYDVTDLARSVASGERNHTLNAWQISLQQALTPAVRVYGRRANSFRLPNVNDNYNPFLARVTLLEPQTAEEAELGVIGGTGAVRYRVSAWRARIHNEIFFDPVTLGSRNRQPTRRQALEFEVQWQALPALGLYANYIHADATFTEGVVRGVPIAGNRVPLAPRHTLNTGLRWSMSDKLRADIDLGYVGSSTFDADETNTFGREIPPYTLVDLKLSWRGNGWLVNGGIRNLFDKEYLSYGVVTGNPTYSAFPAQKRTMFVSAQYSFH